MGQVRPNIAKLPPLENMQIKSSVALLCPGQAYPTPIYSGNIWSSWSDEMNSQTPRSPRSRSQVGGRHPTRPSSHLHSDCPPEQEEDSPSLGQRSVSLTTLPPMIIQPRMAQLETLEAKMASIEVSLSNTPRRKKNGTLNSSITSSIRSIPKEIAVKELENLRNALRDKENIIQTLKSQLTIPNFRLTHSRNNGVCNNNSNVQNNKDLSEIEKKQAEERLNRLRNDIDNKRLAIKNLKLALERLDITDNIDVRIQQAELEYQLGREELNLLTLLEESRTLQLCLEESNKNTSESQTLYSCINGNNMISLHAIQVTYDPKSPRFGAGQKNSNSGLWIDWALEDTGIYKGDRLVEVNGKIVLTKNRDDLNRLLAAAPDPAQIVILRINPINDNNGKNCRSSNNAAPNVSSLMTELEVVRERADEAQRAKDDLKSDNIRLTHRISYLEEQVAELAGRKGSESDIRIINQYPSMTSTVKSNQNITNINITSPQGSVTKNKDLQVFQKGPQMTALVANLANLETSKDKHSALPIRSKSSLSNVSNTHISAPSPHPSEHVCQKTQRHHHKHRNTRYGFHLTNGNNTQVIDNNSSYKKHHHYYLEKDRNYSSEMNLSEQRSKKEDSSVMEQSYKKATKIVYDLTKQANLYEKHKQKCLTASEKYNGDLLRHYNARKSTSVLDFRSEVHIGPKYDSRSVETLDNFDRHINDEHITHRKHDVRSVKSLDFDSDCNSNSNYKNTIQKYVDYTSEPTDTNKKTNHLQHDKARPLPPKKPIRLSLHRALSVQSIENSSAPNEIKDNRKPLKRNYKGEVPPLNTLLSANSEKCLKGTSGHYRTDEMVNGDGDVRWNGVNNYYKLDSCIIENDSWC